MQQSHLEMTKETGVALANTAGGGEVEDDRMRSIESNFLLF